MSAKDVRSEAQSLAPRKKIAAGQASSQRCQGVDVLAWYDWAGFSMTLYLFVFDLSELSLFSFFMREKSLPADCIASNFQVESDFSHGIPVRNLWRR